MPATPEKHSIETPPEAAFRPVHCGQVKAWVMTAQPRARMTYGQGWHLSSACSAEVGEYARVLSDLGLVTLHQSRAGKTAAGLPYLMIRTDKSARGVQI